MRRAIIIIFLAMSLPALAAGTWTTLTVPTTRHAFSIGYSDGPVVSCGAQDVIKSTDGTTWSLKTTTSASYPCYSVHFPSSTTGYIVGADSNGSYVANNRARWWKSSDYGNSWSATAQTFSGAGGANDFYKVFFADNSTGWAAGWPCWNSNNLTWIPNVIKTTDGGTTWAKKVTGLSITDSAIFFGLHFYNSSIGWLAGGPWAGAGVVYRTLDGGDNWTAQTTGSTQPFADVYFLKSDYNHGFLCGWNGTMYKTINGGDNWSSITTSTTASLTAVTFINPNVGYAVGDQGSLLKSVDQGSTWTRSTPGAGTETYTDIYFKDAFHGWISGNNGNVLGFGVAPTASPNTAAVGSSSYVTISGDNFYGANPSYPAYHGFDASCVSFGTASIEVTTLEVISATELRARVNIFPGAVAGIYNLTITDPDNGGTCATTFTVTSSTTGDAGPTISNISVNGESSNQVPLPSADSAASLNCEVEDTGPASVSGREIGDPHGRIYFDTDGSSILNDPNSYEYYIPYPSYTRISATRGTLTANLGNVYRVSDGTLAGQLAARVGTTTSFLPVVYAEDTRGNGTFQAYHRLTFVDSTRDYLLSILPSPGLTLPRTFQIFNRSFAGPVKCIVHDQLGRPLAQMDTTLTPNTRTNVVFDGTTFDGHIANGMYLLMVRAIPAIGAPISQVRSGVLGKVRFVVAR